MTHEKISEVTSEWVMDFGCTFHMTPIKEWLQNLNGKMEDQFSLEMIRVDDVNQV